MLSKKSRPSNDLKMAKTKLKTSRRPRQSQTGPGLVTSISESSLSGCRGISTKRVRDLEWVAPAQALNTAYRIKAAKIYTHGTDASLAPCTRCEKGKGPFHKCVIAWNDKGYVCKGTCANCYWHHKTTSCNRRSILPCQALVQQRQDLGEFEEACRIHCNGAHIREDNEVASNHAGEEESFDEGENDDDDE